MLVGRRNTKQDHVHKVKRNNNHTHSLYTVASFGGQLVGLVWLVSSSLAAGSKRAKNWMECDIVHGMYHRLLLVTVALK